MSRAGIAESGALSEGPQQISPLVGHRRRELSGVAQGSEVEAHGVQADVRADSWLGAAAACGKGNRRKKQPAGFYSTLTRTGVNEWSPLLLPSWPALFEPQQ